MLGRTLGAYRIESELGSGGMGTVYLAEAIEPGAVPVGTRVALKVVHPQLLSEPGFFKRFLREAEIGRAVTHSNVVRCHDCDQLVLDATTHAFLVMEYVEGQTLRGLLEELETVPEELCRHIGREVAKGLAAIHGAGVVHRDLKPENVLITPDHDVKVMDLGVARLADEAIRLSRSGAFVGSVLYASPEQFRSGGGELDGRADLFSLGVILYELACGAHPHPGDDFASVLAKVVEGEPRRLGERNPQVSAFFEEVVHALLAKEREERIPSATKLREVLERGESSTWWGRRVRTLRAETKRPLRRIRIPRETAVHGREEELAELRALYEKARSGDGRVVLIEGEAGIGKTRVVDELIGRLQQDGQDLHFLFGSFPPGGAATASGAWSTAYREQFGAEGLEETLEGYLTVTPGLIPAFAALLRGEPSPRDEEPLTKDSLQMVFIHATRALAGELPAIVLMEDLHFAPEEGRAMFAALALAVPEHRILLVGTARPGVPEDWRANLERLDQVDRMELGRLGPKDLGKLLVDAFRSEKLAEELSLELATKSDGNPFFVFEIIRGLREGQFISQRPDGTWVTTRVIRDIQIPSSVQDLIQVRIADLDEEEQEILDVAACCGFEFDPRLVGEALGLRPVPALRRLGHLEKAHRLVRAAGPSFVFDHHQVQEALYAGISEPLREEYHATIAEALENRHPDPDGAVAVDLCEHFLEAGRGERALPHLNAALEHLEFLDDQAVVLADRALEVEGLLGGAARAEVLVAKGDRLDLLGRRELAEAALGEAVTLAEEAGDRGLCSHARLMVGRCLLNSSRYEAARAEFLLSRDLAREIGDRETEAAATGGLGSALHSLGRFEEAQQHYERGLAIAVETGARGGEAMAAGNLGTLLLSLGRYEEARERFEQSLAIAREIGNRLGEGMATGNLGSALRALGRHEEARGHFERSLAIAREIGNRQGEVMATGNLGNLLMNLGRMEEAGPHFERALALARESGDRDHEATALGSLGLLSRSLGRVEEAGEYFERSLALAREIGSRSSEGIVGVNLGGVLRDLGRFEEARGHTERGLAIAREIGDRRGEALALGSLGVMLRSLGRYEEARESFARSLAVSREIGGRVGEGTSLMHLGRLHATLGALDRAKEQLDESLAILRECGARAREGNALHCLAEVVEAAGEAGRARSFAEETLAVRREIGDGSGTAAALTLLGGILLAEGRQDDARAHLEESLMLAREADVPATIVLAAALLAPLPGGDPRLAIETFREYESRLGHVDRMRARHQLWRATGDAAHLEKAHRLLSHLVDHAPEECRETMVAEVPLHRDILTDWEDRPAAS
jgi:tetratricopeptide (TPR) repeat protein